VTARYFCFRGPIPAAENLRLVPNTAGMSADGSPRKLPFALWPAISPAHKPAQKKARQLLEERYASGERARFNERIDLVDLAPNLTPTLSNFRGRLVDLLPRREMRCS